MYYQSVISNFEASSSEYHDVSLKYYKLRVYEL